MFTILMYIAAFGFLVLSFIKDKKKTYMALKKAWKSFENILPQFLAILVIIGIMLAVLSPEVISGLIGEKSGWLGMLMASLVGSVTLIPGFVAFPLASALLKNGAGFMQIAVFISTLMMVGIVTIPLEIKYFGRKAALLRNSLAFAFSFIVAIAIGVVLR
ncbi:MULTISPECIES: permease [unclassified Desulfosporosinus]|uniref:permease n=1 Tax=unclassified Desulfosporosinus TaxID=2633794 RepID=UPI000B499438|nr:MULTISPECIES: permease [unclassified Desulfosporosinus]